MAYRLERPHTVWLILRQSSRFYILLISGASHGGTAPMVMIATHRALRDYASVWTGSTHTAVIMFDGISNPCTLDEWVGSQAVGPNCGLFHRRWVGRYGDGAPLVHMTVRILFAAASRPVPIAAAPTRSTG